MKSVGFFLRLIPELARRRGSAGPEATAVAPYDLLALRTKDAQLLIMLPALKRQMEKLLQQASRSELPQRQGMQPPQQRQYPPAPFQLSAMGLSSATSSPVPVVASTSSAISALSRFDEGRSDAAMTTLACQVRICRRHPLSLRPLWQGVALCVGNSMALNAMQPSWRNTYQSSANQTSRLLRCTTRG